MSDWASLGPSRLVSGSIQIPKVGLWVADVIAADDSIISPLTVLVVADLSLVGYVFRSFPFGGSRAFRVVGGYGGWQKKLPARAYQMVSGVPSSIVLSHLAIESGEILGPVITRSLGPSYARFAGFAGASLAAIEPSWRVDPLGVTQTTPWPTTLVKSQFTPSRPDGFAGLVSVATENPGAWLPGATFAHELLGSDLLTARSVRHHFNSGGISRVEVLT